MDNLEVKRKIAHLFTGLFIVIAYNYGILTQKYIFFLIIFFGIISLISMKFKLPIANFLLKNFEREKYIKKFPFKGMIFFLGGALLAIKLFPEDIALASIMILTFGDSVSYLVGQFLGKTKLAFNGLKKLEGILAGMLFAFLGSIVFVNLTEGFFASLFAMIVEGAGFKIGVSDIDDNFIVPLVAGTVIYLFRTGFKIFLI
ncbi:MAG: phosphatidate cytidylyltransferase [Nanoarchaeota archaeon]